MSASPFPTQDATPVHATTRRMMMRTMLSAMLAPSLLAAVCRSGSDTKEQLAQELEDGLPRRRIRYAASARLEFPRIFGKFLDMEKVPRSDRDWGGPVMFIVAVPSQSLALLKEVLEDARGEQPLCRQSQSFHRRADGQAHGKRSPIQQAVHKPGYRKRRRRPAYTGAVQVP